MTDIHREKAAEMKMKKDKGKLRYYDTIEGYVVSDACDNCANFMLKRSIAEKFAGLLRKEVKNPDWVHIRKATFIRTPNHEGWCQT